MKIKDMRVSKGMTQEQLAEAVKVKRSTVAMWETERCKPTADKLIALAKLFDCTIDELIRTT